jgi:hypothetical protein
MTLEKPLGESFYRPTGALSLSHPPAARRSRGASMTPSDARQPSARRITPTSQPKWAPPRRHLHRPGVEPLRVPVPDASLQLHREGR